MNENLQTVVTSVNDILKDTNLNSITEIVVERLVFFGWQPTDADAWLIAFSVQKAANHVLNQTNQAVIPKGLVEIVVDMACGEILNAKYLSGQLDLENIDLNGIIQSVAEGDTTVTFSETGSDDEKIRGLLNWLIQGKGCDLLCYRKMRW